MQEAIKISRLYWVVAIACFVVTMSFDSAAQEDKPLREVYQAQAMGQSTQMGKTFNVTINVERYSTPEERQVLVDAFQEARSEGLYNALEKMNAKGRIAIGHSRLRHQLYPKDSDRGRLQTSHPNQSPDQFRRAMGEWPHGRLQSLGSRSERYRG
jgi:hypothetical protein